MSDNGWQETTVDAGGGARLAAQSLGSAGDPTLLLLNAATWSRDWWDDDLCARLVGLGLRVVRYDTRDTGGSTGYPPGEPGYTSSDLEADAVAVLDAFEVDRAVVMGLSMGGGLAQRLAITHRDRVRALVLISTTPIDDVPRDLPGPTPEIMATFTDAAPDPDWTDRAAVVDWVVENERPYAGPGSFDEAAVREVAGRVWDRTSSMASAGVNHVAVPDEPGVSFDLGGLADVPTLVVHGSADPMFPLAHGRALADAIPGARLLVLPDVGHQLPPRRTWPELLEAVRGVVATESP